jgi:hypothetical protein
VVAPDPVNGLLPALRAGPFHLFRLHLDLRSDVLKKVTVTFPSEKVFSHRRPSGSQAVRVTQCCGANLPDRRQPRQNKNRRPIPPLIGSVHLSPAGPIFVSVVACAMGWRDRSASRQRDRPIFGRDHIFSSAQSIARRRRFAIQPEPEVWVDRQGNGFNGNWPVPGLQIRLTLSTRCYRSTTPARIHGADT